MAETPSEPAPAQSLSDFELAEPLVRQIEIKGIMLARGTMLRAPRVDLAESGLKLDHSLAAIGYGIDKEHNTFFAELTFLLHPSKDGQIEEDPRVFVTASFVINYSVKSFEGLDERNVEAFAKLNAVHNAWPYWREFLQNATSRMGVPTITAPVFRLT